MEAGKKTEMSSLDIRFIIAELKEKFIGGVFRKAYQYKSDEENQFLFEIYNKGENAWLYADSGKIFLTEFKKAVPQSPPSFCMFLRKHLLGQKIKNITQHKFDRVVEIEADENFLIFELFSSGNVILTDSSHQTIMPLHFQRWKDREVKPKIGYKYPAGGMDPFALRFDEFRKALKTYDKPVAAVLATAFGFGREYANEICAIAEIDPKKLSCDIDLQASLKLHKIIEIIKEAEAKPVLYENSVTPFSMKTYGEGRMHMTFSAALDEYFSSQQIQVEKEEKKEAVKKAEEKVEKIIQTQHKSIEKWDRIKSESKDIADLIYTNYGLVENIIGGIRKAIDSGESWALLKEKIKSEDTPEANAIKEVKEHDGVVVIELGGHEVEIDFNKSVEENAARFYEDVKWARKKAEGAEKAMEEQKEKKADVATAAPEEKPEIKIRKKWYEKYKWFISSSGFLVIAGRNAEQNETIVKSYAEPKDFLFHADIVGAAFVLAKSDGKEIDGITMKEGAEFSAANSKAWVKGLGTVDVYAFRPEQASKPSGGMEHGSFVVSGQKIWFRNQELKLSVGIKINKELDYAKVVSGPVMAVRSHSDYFVTIKPGFKDSIELIRDVRNRLVLKARMEDRFLIEKVSNDDFQGCIPSGRGDIVG